MAHALPGPKCGVHPRVAAAWRCTGCDTHLCAACTAVRNAGPASFDVCTRCGELAQRLMVPRTAIPLIERLPAAVLYPLAREGVGALLTLVAMNALFSAVAWIFPNVLLALLASGLTWAYLFHEMRAAADPRLHKTVPELGSTLADWIAPAFKGALAMALVWMPAAVWLATAHHVPWGEAPPVSVLRDPFVWLCLAAGILYAPMAALAAATGIGFAGMCNPVRIVTYIRRAGREYITTVAVLACLATVAGVLRLLVSTPLRGMPAPSAVSFVVDLVADAIDTVVPLAMARTLGLLLYLRGDALDWGNAADHMMPLVQGAQAHGQLPKIARTPAKIALDS